ncbi:hypothetical protein RI065_08200 [Mycoplasmatota bacterium zrk1]
MKEFELMISDEYVNQDVFNNQILSFVRKREQEEKVFSLLIDLSRANYVTLNVMVNLLLLGTYTDSKGIQLRIKLEPVSKLTEYFYDTGFMRTIIDNNVITFYGVDPDGTSPTLSIDIGRRKATNIICILSKDNLYDIHSRRYIFKTEDERTIIRRLLEIEIYGNIDPYGDIHLLNRRIKINDLFASGNSYTEYVRVISNVAYTSEYSHTEKRQVKYLDFERLILYADMLIEVIENSILHGGEMCAVGFQAYQRKGENPVIEISISDMGPGCYSTIKEKIDDDMIFDTFTVSVDEYKNLINDNTYNGKLVRDYYSIYESILCRRKLKKRGIYNIFADLAKMKDVHTRVEYKNNNVRINFGNNEIRDLLGSVGKSDNIHNIKEKLPIFLRDIKAKNVKSSHKRKQNLVDHNPDSLPGVNLLIKVS